MEQQQQPPPPPSIGMMQGVSHQLQYPQMPNHQQQLQQQQMMLQLQQQQQQQLQLQQQQQAGYPQGSPGVSSNPGTSAGQCSYPPPAVGQQPGVFQHLQQHHQQQLQAFWLTQAQEIAEVVDFKTHQLPLARIKKIMKADEDVRMISAEAPVLFAKACEMFILELTLRSWIHTEENKRRTLQKNDIAAAITRTDIFDFLVDIVPRDELKDEGSAGSAAGLSGVIPRAALPVGAQQDALPYSGVYFVAAPVGPPGQQQSPGAASPAAAQQMQQQAQLNMSMIPPPQIYGQPQQQHLSRGPPLPYLQSIWQQSNAAPPGVPPSGA